MHSAALEDQLNALAADLNAETAAGTVAWENGANHMEAQYHGFLTIYKAPRFLIGRGRVSFSTSIGMELGTVRAPREMSKILTRAIGQHHAELPQKIAQLREQQDDLKAEYVKNARARAE